MKYDGKWFGDHLGDFSFGAFKKEVDSSFTGDPKKEEKIAELFALFQLRKPGALKVGYYGNDRADTSEI